MGSLEAENFRLRALLAQTLPLLPKDYSWIQLAKEIHAALQGQTQACTEHRWAVMESDMGSGEMSYQTFLVVEDTTPRFCANPGCTAKASEVQP